MKRKGAKTQSENMQPVWSVVHNGVGGTVLVIICLQFVVFYILLYQSLSVQYLTFSW